MTSKGFRHSPESIEKMRQVKAAWWKNSSPEKIAEAKKKMKDNHARPGLGKTGEKSSSWKGGRFTDKRDGYVHVYAPDHPSSVHNSKGGGGYVLEHRLILEQSIGRYLESDEDVNHINGAKDDNRLENLMLVRHNAHYALLECPSCHFTWGVR